MIDHLRPVRVPHEEPARASATRRAPRPRAQFALPTDRMKFEMQVDALRAIAVSSNYGERGVSAEDIAPRIGVVPATACLNNTFFVSAGLIERERKGHYKPTEATSEFARKSTFNERQAATLLAKSMREAWFFREIEQQLAMGPTKRERAIEVLAHAAGASKDHETQLSGVLSWLEYVGLIVITDGFIQRGQRDMQELYDAPEQELPPRNDPTGAASQTATKRERPSSPKTGPTVLSLSFQMALTADDLRTLDAGQIAALFEAVGKVAAIKAAMA